MINATKFKAYVSLLRLDKPIFYWLLMWPTLWGLVVASQGVPEPLYLFIFICGVFVMRSAGCVINDLTDWQLDQKVARTQQRPLASGVLHKHEAVLVLFILLSIALLLVLQLPGFCLALAFIALPLISIYPWLKRVTYYPQVMLGILFGGMPVLFAFAAIQQQLPFVAWLLFVIASLWPIGYDTIYGLQDKTDDLKIGVKSLTIKVGTHLHTLITVIQITFFSLWLLLAYLQHKQFLFYLSWVSAICLAIYQQRVLRQQVVSYSHIFYSTHWQGLLLFLGLLFG